MHNKNIYNNISSNPLDRVSPAMIPMINSPETKFDVHCHIFNFETVPKKYLFLKLPVSYKSQHDELEKLEKHLHNLHKKTNKDHIKFLANFIDTGNQESMKNVAGKLFSYYPSDTIFTPLMMDMEYGLQSKPLIPYSKQVEEMRKLSTSVFPHKMLPFLALDPRNPNLFKLFEKSMSKGGGFFGVKLYPSLGYLPSDKQLMKIFEICEAKNIPVTTHVGGNTVHTTQRFIKVTGKQVAQSGELKDRVVRMPHLFRMSGKKTGEVLNNPKNWEPVLYSFPNLKLNLGHFGGTTEWLKHLKSPAPRIMQIINLIQRYDYVFSDFSNNFEYPEITVHLKKMLLSDSKIKSRTLFGSDFFMVLLASDYTKSRVQFEETLGPELLKIISHENPKNFLFTKAVK